MRGKSLPRKHPNIKLAFAKIKKVIIPTNRAGKGKGKRKGQAADGFIVKGDDLDKIQMEPSLYGLNQKKIDRDNI